MDWSKFYLIDLSNKREFPFLPVDLDNFIEQVAPLLKTRGVMKQAYSPGTLREKLGLAPVTNQFSTKN